MGLCFPMGDSPSFLDSRDVGENSTFPRHGSACLVTWPVSTQHKFIKENVINHMSGHVGGSSASCFSERQASQPAGHPMGVGPEPGTEAQCPLSNVGSPTGKAPGSSEGKTGRSDGEIELLLSCPLESWALTAEKSFVASRSYLICASV